MFHLHKSRLPYATFGNNHVAMFRNSTLDKTDFLYHSLDTLTSVSCGVGRAFIFQQEKIKHMNFLQGTSKPKTDEDRKRERREKGTNKGQKIDPLLKKVMSKVFTNKVMNETTAAYYQQAQQRDALED